MNKVPLSHLWGFGEKNARAYLARTKHCVFAGTSKLSTNNIPSEGFGVIHRCFTKHGKLCNFAWRLRGNWTPRHLPKATFNPGWPLESIPRDSALRKNDGNRLWMKLVGLCHRRRVRISSFMSIAFQPLVAFAASVLHFRLCDPPRLSVIRYLSPSHGLQKYWVLSTWIVLHGLYINPNFRHISSILQQSFLPERLYIHLIYLCVTGHQFTLDSWSSLILILDFFFFKKTKSESTYRESYCSVTVILSSQSHLKFLRNPFRFHILYCFNYETEFIISSVPSSCMVWIRHQRTYS